MIESLEKNLQREERPILKERDFKDFIETRDIAPEDFDTIKRFSSYPKDFFIGMHNFFANFMDSRHYILELEGLIKVVQERIKEAANDEKRKNLLIDKEDFYYLLIKFINKYDWTTAKHLIAVFERRKIEK